MCKKLCVRFKYKRFYNRETIPFIKISPLAESPLTLSCFAKIFPLRNGLIILVEYKGKEV